MLESTPTSVILHSHVSGSLGIKVLVENHYFSKFSSFPLSTVVSEESKAILILSPLGMKD